MGIDELDGRLIVLLAREPRIGVLEASRRLGVARGTVQSRMDRLQSNGVIRGFGPDVDPAALGYRVTAFATLEIRQGQGPDVRAHLAQVPEVLELVGLEGKAERLPHELSGGEQQRVAIARAFANRPMVLLADEPTGNLDPDTSQDIMLLLERINRTGTTVLMATHDHSIVDSMRRRVVELSMGKLIRDEVRGVYGVGR